MRTSKFTLVIVVTFAVGVLAGTAVAVFAQADHANLPAKPVITITTDTAGRIISTNGVAPKTLSNSDIALRVVGEHHGRVVAQLMAKVNGSWVEVQLAPQDALLNQ